MVQRGNHSSPPNILLHYICGESCCDEGLYKAIGELTRDKILQQTKLTHWLFLNVTERRTSSFMGVKVSWRTGPGDHAGCEYTLRRQS